LNKRFDVKIVIIKKSIASDELIKIFLILICFIRSSIPNKIIKIGENKNIFLHKNKAAKDIPRKIGWR
tara:strand:- start:159 stop:362 length:204 start_codon:yes stop_codon:yes gene_type:complete